MKPSLMEILVCPVCKGPLKLEVLEEKDGDIITGSLYCAKCNYKYPIVDSIPNLLPPDYKG
jgi:uncharacterized protein